MLRYLLSLIVILASATAAGGEPAQRLVQAKDVGPTQVEIGHYAAGFKLQTWKNEAKAAGVTFNSYVKNQLTAKFDGKPIPAIIDPKGKVRMLDGHHKLTALRTIEREMGIKVLVRIQVVHDYKGQSFDRYARHLVGTLGKGYFGAKPPASAIAKVKTLPSSFDKLGDNPLRSVLGVVFTKSGLEGSWFADYIQFHLGEKLMAGGLEKELQRQGLTDRNGKLASDSAGNPRVIKAVTRMVFSNPKLDSYLRGKIKP
ncbi:MAG: hypothetical protein KJO07_03095, partial [Deltaproteobacteria bacterium]|nr:hypothetical protein [Deltaproteobacteria bacterium]